jgi:hypothetical protein
MPSHSERVRRNYENGWWKQFEHARRQSRDASRRNDETDESQAAQNAVASQPVTSATVDDVKKN